MDGLKESLIDSVDEENPQRNNEENHQEEERENQHLLEEGEDDDNIISIEVGEQENSEIIPSGILDRKRSLLPPLRSPPVFKEVLNDRGERKALYLVSEDEPLSEQVLRKREFYDRALHYVVFCLCLQVCLTLCSCGLLSALVGMTCYFLLSNDFNSPKTKGFLYIVLYISYFNICSFVLLLFSPIILVVVSVLFLPLFVICFPAIVGCFQFFCFPILLVLAIPFLVLLLPFFFVFLVLFVASIIVVSVCIGGKNTNSQS